MGTGKTGSIFLALALFWACGFLHNAHAAPAAPVVHELRQSDGSIVKAVQWGDEFMHGYETLDGYAIGFDKKSRNWKFMHVDARGLAFLLPENAGVNPPPQGILKYAARSTGHSEMRASLRAPALLSQQIVAPTGMANVLVILVNFSDTTPAFSAGDFNSLLFSDNGSFSMKGYYEEVSYGAFTVSPGPGGVAGWYTASKLHDYYGENNEDGTDRYPGTLVREAVAAADAAGLDFVPYDQNADGYVDFVAIVHQGAGEEYSAAAYEYGRSDGGPYIANDGVAVDNYIILPEVQYDSSHVSTIGVFAHEYGHALGLPDLYDTDYSSQGIGYWSLMAYGMWCFVTTEGDRPCHPDAWCKYVLGWVTPRLLTADADNQSLEQAATAPDVYKLLSGSPSSGGEYFLVENRQRTGFDQGLPGAGLLIWHIDESVVDEFGQPANMNECRHCGKWKFASQHYHVALEQADGKCHLEKNKNSGDDADPYPGTAGNRAFTNVSFPASRLWDGSPSNVRITSISDSGPVMSFKSSSTLCSITLIPSCISKALSMIKPVAGFVMIGHEAGAFLKDTEIAWSTGALQTLLKVPVGINKQAMMLIVLVRPWLLEVNEEVEVSAGGCTGGLLVKFL